MRKPRIKKSVYELYEDAMRRSNTITSIGYQKYLDALERARIIEEAAIKRIDNYEKKHKIT